MSEELKETYDGPDVDSEYETEVEEYDAMITVTKGGKNFIVVIASALASIAVTKALSLGFPIPEEVQNYLTSGLIALFSAIVVAAGNYLKHRNLGAVATVATVAAPAALEKLAEKAEKLKEKVKEEFAKKKDEPVVQVPDVDEVREDKKEAIPVVATPIKDEPKEEKKSDLEKLKEIE